MLVLPDNLIHRVSTPEALFAEASSGRRVDPVRHSHRASFGLARLRARLSTLAAALILSPALIAGSIAAPGVAAAQETGKAANDSRLLNLVPAEAVERLASQQFAELKRQASQKRALAPADHPDAQRLRAIARRILPHAVAMNPRAGQWQWEVVLIGSDQINAFCMPGGKIAVYTGLLKAIRPTDDEVAVVMGHEIAHALLEHSRERIAKGQLTQLGAGVISQLLGLGQIGNTALGVGANMLSLKFSRSDETEADRMGLELAARGGFDPRAGITLWRKMASASKGATPEWFSSHPSGDNRIREIESYLPQVMPFYTASSRNRGAVQGR